MARDIGFINRQYYWTVSGRADKTEATTDGGTFRHGFSPWTPDLLRGGAYWTETAVFFAVRT